MTDPSNAAMTSTPEQMTEAANFLLERLDDFERGSLGDDIEDACRDFDGYVAPAMARLTMALRASPVSQPEQKPVAVRALEWEHYEDQPSGPEHEKAPTAFGIYFISVDPFSFSPVTSYEIEGPGGFHQQFAIIGEAKAAAQADYETRIRSALEDSPPVAVKDDTARSPLASVTEQAVEAARMPSSRNYTPEQLAKLAFAVFYSGNLCAPQNIDAVVKEIDCEPGCEHAGRSYCNKFEKGEYCPFSLAEDLRNISLALYGPRDPSGYVASVFGPALSSPQSQPHHVAGEAWQPIETAPKDGTHIIGISSRDGDVFRISWGRNRAGYLVWCESTGWRTASEVEFWMPLPAPPVPEQGGQR